MFDLIRKHTRVLFFFLILMVIPSFVFFGIEGYSKFRDTSAAVVAKVGGLDITQAEWDAAHRDQVERIRRQSPQLDAKLLDSPELKAESLDMLIRERLMLVASDKMHLVTTDARMLRLFREEPQFAFLRQPDGSLNKAMLQAQGMSAEMFEQRLRRDISMRQVTQGVEGSVLAPAAAASAGLGAFFQQREIQVQRFDPAAYSAQVKVADADIEKFYRDPAHNAQFQAPEQADIEYLVLDIDAIKKDIKVNEDDLKKYYAENEARYATPEERRASHILITVDKAASADDRAKAKARAEALLAEVRKNPASFAEVARKNSQDPGSAANGGDLDFFGKGAMVKPFEEAAFALKPGSISDVVTSDFGYHIIQVTGARGGEKKPFDSVRGEIEEQIRRQLAQQRYAELAADFGNVVYEQSDSLKPAAEKFKLELRTAQGVPRTPAPGATGALASPKFIDALFGNDALRNKRNTDAVEIGANQLAAGRIVKHSPARLRPLDEVREQVKTQVVAEQAAALARKAGEARLAELKAKPDAALSEPAVTVSRLRQQNLPPTLVDAVLRTPAPLPSVIGVDLKGQGYAVVKVLKVSGIDESAGDAKRRQTQYAQALTEAESAAYFDALKARYKADRTRAAGAAAAASAASN
jgi:peptidyl-prolyl cis-trans isomerase D